MHSRATTEGVRPNARENSQIRPSTIVRTARAAGSHPHLASVLLQGLKSANIYVSSGVIRERWSHFLRQPAKVDSTMQRTIHHEDAETVFAVAELASKHELHPTQIAAW